MLGGCVDVPVRGRLSQCLVAVPAGPGPVVPMAGWPAGSKTGRDKSGRGRWSSHALLGRSPVSGVVEVGVVPRFCCAGRAARRAEGAWGDRALDKGYIRATAEG